MAVSLFLLPSCALVFLFMAGGWLWAVRAPTHRWSRWWYGRVWDDRFAPPHRRATIIRGYGMSSINLALGSMWLLTMVNPWLPLYAQGIGLRMGIILGGLFGWELCWWRAHTIDTVRRGSR